MNESLKEYLNDAREELKRVDHLIYVSLKYTRTVDVIKSIIVRLIDSFDFMLNGILEDLKVQGKIEEVPVAPKLKCDFLLKFHNDAKVQEMIDFYLLLRKLNTAKYTEHEEFRRHVTMRATIGEIEMDVTIDLVEEYYYKAKGYLDYLEKMLGEQNG
jgi:hypothetical protein